MPPFQELVNHAEKKNLTLPHQNNQIQDLYTKKCDRIFVFDFNNTKHNRKFISKYFNIV